MFKFGTKAETLDLLREKIGKSKICQSVVFTVEEWQKNPSGCTDRIRAEFAGRNIIIRSSALNEDAHDSTMAGWYHSIGDVPVDSEERLVKNVNRVIESYGKADSSVHLRSQVLVQPMVTDISMSGVIFTQDLNTGSPYYVINYDDVTGQTDTVTSGTGDIIRTLLVHRGALDQVHSPRFRSLLDSVKEVEDLVSFPGLDIEFAVTQDGEVYIFQVRRLPVQDNWNRERSDKVDAAIAEIVVFLDERRKLAGGVLGGRSLWGIMPDWNPAEMIGVCPRMLARSLYQYLITDRIWAEARGQMGYANLRKQPLMVNLGGRPYIDVRNSFNSFLPSDLPRDIGEKLVDLWLDTLEANPELHDKVEFEIATTVHSFDLDTRVKPILLEGGLSEGEYRVFKKSLKDLTNSIVCKQGRIIEIQLERVEEMVSMRKACEVDLSQLENRELLFLVRSLLEEGRDYGTLPFSILARCNFIGEDLLRSLVAVGLLGEEEALAFRKSIKTVLSSFLEKVEDFQAEKISADLLLQEYGHLRPGTYNILSKRYDQRFEEIVVNDLNRQDSKPHDAVEDVISLERLEAIDTFLIEEGYAFDAAGLFEFIGAAIEGREYAKLQFTHNLSDAIEIIALWGGRLGLSREELSHLSLWDILGSLTETALVPQDDHLRAIVKDTRESYAISQAIRLPYLITGAEDVGVVPILVSRPNFITKKSVRASVILLVEQEERVPLLEGKIVLIEGADPGYDWIFTYPIAGLITKYGGANSHMAIRCAEMDIPAAIGCGEQLFNCFAVASEVALDCGSELVLPL